jgi:hypothetical protein
MWHSVMNNCEWLLLHVGEDYNKGINNLNGVFSGVTRYNWWSEVVEYPEHCTVYTVYETWWNHVPKDDHVADSFTMHLNLNEKKR